MKTRKTFAAAILLLIIGAASYGIPFTFYGAHVFMLGMALIVVGLYEFFGNKKNVKKKK